MTGSFRVVSYKVREEEALVLGELAQCANYFRRMPDRASRRLRSHRSDGGKKPPLTSQQLSAIFSLAKFRGLDQGAVASLTRERFTKEPEELDRQRPHRSSVTWLFATRNRLVESVPAGGDCTRSGSIK